LFPFSVLGGINIRWLIFSRGSLIYLPFWIKSIIIVLIIRRTLLLFSVVNRGVYRRPGKFSYFLANIWYMPLLFRRVSTLTSLSQGNANIKTSESSWVELLLYKLLSYQFKKISAYLYHLVTSYFVNSFLILILLIFLLH